MLSQPYNVPCWARASPAPPVWFHGLWALLGGARSRGTPAIFPRMRFFFLRGLRKGACLHYRLASHEETLAASSYDSQSSRTVAILAHLTRISTAKQRVSGFLQPKGPSCSLRPCGEKFSSSSAHHRLRREEKRREPVFKHHARFPVDRGGGCALPRARLQSPPPSL